MEHKKPFATALFWTILIAVACLVSASKIPSVPIFGKDKLIHAFFYFVFTVLWFRFVSRRFSEKTRVKKLLWVFFSALFYGCLIEIGQELFTMNRHADFKDVLANLTGSALAIIMIVLVERYRKVKSFNE